MPDTNTIQNPSSLEQSLTIDDVELISARQRYSGFYRIEECWLRHRLFSGKWSSKMRREIIVKPDAVAVLVHDPELDTVLLVQQFRAPIMKRTQVPWTFELVAGLVDKANEEKSQVAQRELFEEAGLKVNDLQPVCEHWSSPGGSNERISIFAARADLSNAGGIFGQEDEHEDIRAVVIPRKEALQWALNSGQANASLLVALLWLDNSLLRDIG